MTGRIPKHFIDDLSGRACFDGIGGDVFGKRNQRLPQRPTASSRPGRAVHGLGKLEVIVKGGDNHFSPSIYVIACRPRTEPPGSA